MNLIYFIFFVNQFTLFNYLVLLFKDSVTLDLEQHICFRDRSL